MLILSLLVNIFFLSLRQYLLSFSQALDAKVIIFKKKRRKNYRRTKGHRQVCLKMCMCYVYVLIYDLFFLTHGLIFVQELTKLRIVDIQGIEKRVEVATAA